MLRELGRDAVRDDLRLAGDPRRRAAAPRARFPTPCAPGRRAGRGGRGAAPDQLTTSWRKEGRGGRIFVDAARNTYAQTAVAAYAVRAKPGAPVATPLAWEELSDPELSPRRWTLRDVPARLSERGDPWAGIAPAAAALPASTAAG